jgi:hypothetical protein
VQRLVRYDVRSSCGIARSAAEESGPTQVISRLKVLAELDISERRIPQDGSFRVESGGREIDLRVSIMPSIHGEDAVIRILEGERLRPGILGWADFQETFAVYWIDEPRCRTDIIQGNVDYYSTGALPNSLPLPPDGLPATVVLQSFRDGSVEFKEGKR